MKFSFYVIWCCVREGAKSAVVNLIVVSTFRLKNGISWKIVHEKWSF